MKSTKISRRKFLTYTLVGTSSIALLGTVSWYRAKDFQIVISILKRRLDTLDINQNIFSYFAKEYVNSKKDYQKQLKVLSTISGVYDIITPYNYLEMGHPLRRLEDNIVSLFLLSTDFFDHNSDVNREIQYLGFYDPYKIPCRNLFQRPEY